MAREIIPHRIKDWSQLDKSEGIWGTLSLDNPERNFGIHKYNDGFWTSGYVGVGRLYNKKQQPICTEGKEHVVVISPQYDLNPWKMLELVMSDDEYEDYISSLDNERFLFKVFYDEPLIRLAKDEQNDADLLYALSFVNSCYALCKKGLKKSLYYQEENCQSKVHGKINVKKNIRENTRRGRNDRFYCQYIDFTENNIENRILKTTLVKCKKLLSERFEIGQGLAQRIGFCEYVFRRVNLVQIKLSDFNSASVSGLYMYYKPLLRQAKCIHSQKYYSYSADNGVTITRSVFTVPYMINMETLFEFYARILTKKALEGTNYTLSPYAQKIFLQKNVTDMSQAEKGIHLIPYCIPDLIICERNTSNPIIVLEAKYKQHNRSARTDSHQLLSYVLLTGVKKCGFVFPGEDVQIKTMSTGISLPLNVPDLDYYEILINNELKQKHFDQIITTT